MNIISKYKLNHQVINNNSSTSHLIKESERIPKKIGNIAKVKLKVSMCTHWHSTHVHAHAKAVRNRQHANRKQ